MSMLKWKGHVFLNFLFIYHFLKIGLGISLAGVLLLNRISIFPDRSYRRLMWKNFIITRSVS